MLVIFDNSKSTVSSCDIVKKIEREIGLNGWSEYFAYPDQRFAISGR